MSFDILKGMATTLKNIGKKPTTVSYPEEERVLPARFRGRHVLHRYENGLERCVGCYLCAGACPASLAWRSPRGVSSRSASGFESCGTASPCRSSQIWGAIAPRRIVRR